MWVGWPIHPNHRDVELQLRVKAADQGEPAAHLQAKSLADLVQDRHLERAAGIGDRPGTGHEAGVVLHAREEAEHGQVTHLLRILVRQCVGVRSCSLDHVDADLAERATKLCADSLECRCCVSRNEASGHLDVGIADVGIVQHPVQAGE